LARRAGVALGDMCHNTYYPFPQGETRMLELLTRPLNLLAAELSVADLKTIQDQLDAARTRLEQQSELFHALMQLRFESEARAEYARQKKETGIVRFAASNTLSLKAEVEKQVKWDQDRLPRILKSMSAADAAHFGKITYEVAEHKFNAATPKLKKALEAARALVGRPMRFTLVNMESEPQDLAQDPVAQEIADNVAA
jgi:hypothetical protein